MPTCSSGCNDRTVSPSISQDAGSHCVRSCWATERLMSSSARGCSSDARGAGWDGEAADRGHSAHRIIGHWLAAHEAAGLSRDRRGRHPYTQGIRGHAGPPGPSHSPRRLGGTEAALAGESIGVRAIVVESLGSACRRRGRRMRSHMTAERCSASLASRAHIAPAATVHSTARAKHLRESADYVMAAYLP
jgi:hypothetical protein